jgi:hypothetical protein
MSSKTQRLAARVWPVTLIVMVVLFPFLVRKSYQELKNI